MSDVEHPKSSADMIRDARKELDLPADEVDQEPTSAIRDTSEGATEPLSVLDEDALAIGRDESFIPARTPFERHDNPIPPPRPRRPITRPDESIARPGDEVLRRAEQRPSPPVERPSVPVPVPAQSEPQEPGLLSKLWRKRAWLIGIGLLGFWVVSFFDSTTAVNDVGVGDCIEDPGVGVVFEVESISCNGPHDYEVFASVRVGKSADPYPGDNILADSTDLLCYGAFTSYVGVSYDNSVYYFNTLVPTRDSWGEGDRDATCMLFEVDGAGNPSSAMSSARGSNR